MASERRESARIRGAGRRLRAALGACAVALGLVPAGAAAQDELSLMREPTSFTDVVDAFDEGDAFDVNISIGYLRTWELGRVQREMNGPGSADGRMTRHWQDAADYSREVNQLVFGLDVGLFRDFAAYARLPLVLSDDRTLSGVGGALPTSLLSDRSDSPASLFHAPDGALRFRSPTRSGVDYVAAGLAWSVLNQQRDRHVPTWVLMLEGRFNLGEPMHACGIAADGSNDCLTGRVEAGRVVRGGDPGVGRGNNALRVETRASYRYEYIEPYFGLAFQAEFPGSGDRFFTPHGSLAGYINQRPPMVGSMTVGTAIIPWEDRQHWQRFTIDLRFTGDYVSEGREYSPLFDALGASHNPYLTSLNCEGLPTSGSCSDAGLLETPFYGLTDVQAHVRIGGRLGLEIQAARYVRFGLSTAVFHSPSYGLTQADACNPNESPNGVDDPRAGNCRTGIVNPHHREAIDLPGQRFRMESLTQIDVAATVTALF